MIQDTFNDNDFFQKELENNSFNLADNYKELILFIPENLAILKDNRNNENMIKAHGMSYRKIEFGLYCKLVEFYEANSFEIDPSNIDVVLDKVKRAYNTPTTKIKV